MKLSIVTTLYKSSPYIEEFYKRISKEAEKITADYEIIFVDDGSPDDSLHKAIELYKKDKKVKVIELSRNFGHHKAIITGLEHAKGEYIFLIDSDLEEPPELLSRFWEEFHKYDDIDVVYGIQEKRKGRWFEKWSGELFYTLFNYLSDIKIPKNAITARLMTKNYVKALTLQKEREVFLFGLFALTGFKQKNLIVNKHSKGSTTYNLGRKISMLFTAITSFSDYILKLVFYLGFIISVLSFVFLLLVIIKKLVFNTPIVGWTSLIVSIWFFGGTILTFLGFLGIYISKIFIETKKRPYTIIRRIYESK